MQENTKNPELQYSIAVSKIQMLLEDIYSFDIKEVKKISADFIENCLYNEVKANFLLELVFLSCNLASNFGDMGKEFFDFTSESFENAFFLMKYNSPFFFKTIDKVMNILDLVSGCPQDFSSKMKDIFNEYYN